MAEEERSRAERKAQDLRQDRLQLERLVPLLFVSAPFTLCYTKELGGCDLQAPSGLRVGQSGAGEAEGQTPGAGGEILQVPGGAGQSLHPRARAAAAGGCSRNQEVYTAFRRGAERDRESLPVKT